jgi:8-oxo-dGTP diphosphatase
MVIRHFGEPFLSSKVYKRRPGIYVILPTKYELLVTVQEEPNREIQLPGGGIEKGEQYLQALYREVIEETGWVISDPLRIGLYKYYTYMPEYSFWAEKLCHIYTARPIIQKCDPTQKGHYPVWLPASDAIEKLASEGDKTFVQNYFKL